MDTLLIAVTVLSLAMASAMSLVVLKLLREDRRRSEARITALLEAASAGRPLSGRPPRHGAARTEAPHGAAAAPPRKRAAYSGGTAERSGDLPLRPAPATAELFVEPERRASWGPRIALAAGAIAVLLGVGFTMLGRDAASPAVPAAASAAPLELLTLRHTAGAGSLTVSGLVQNPRGGAALRRVTAAVYALDANGEVLATSRAPIDLTTFGPGEESPFVVTVRVPRAVARYRVGFRTDGGDVIAHVDRRADAEALAHK